jgi:hypothetical protein
MATGGWAKLNFEMCSGVDCLHFSCQPSTTIPIVPTPLPTYQPGSRPLASDWGKCLANVRRKEHERQKIVAWVEKRKLRSNARGYAQQHQQQQKQQQQIH